MSPRPLACAEAVRFGAAAAIDLDAEYAFPDRMTQIHKVCPVVLRTGDGRREVLAFSHPVAGKQFVKGTIETAEAPCLAARRELREESGLDAPQALLSLGIAAIGVSRQPWHFFKWTSAGLPDSWSHQTQDDYGHRFEFFWHPLHLQLCKEWHPMFHEAFDYFAPLVSDD